MKRALSISIALVVAFGVALSTPSAAISARSNLAASPQGAPLKTIQGTVKAEGDKVTFVADEDGKSWDVMNPETLKAHSGHHVEINAHVYSDKNSIHVMSVKMVKKAS